MIDAIRFEGPEPGPKLLFLGGVHGEEKPGILALEKLIKELRQGGLRLLKGRVTIAARVNAEAAARNVHQIDENLNRVVGVHAEPATHERRLANELAAHIDSADVVLDLHGTPAPTSPFAFLDDESPENRAWAAALGVDVLLLGWPALFAGGGTATTTEYAQSRGKRALTIEVGRNDDLASARLGYAFALRSLVHFGLTTPVSPPGPARELRLTRVFQREREGSFARAWKNFDPVKKGEVLARYSDGAEIAAPESGFVVMPYDAAKIGEEWFYLAK